jgi:opacity protein-like surface antigen
MAATVLAVPAGAPAPEAPPAAAMAAAERQGGSVVANLGHDEDTLIGGFHIGYNWQKGQIVYGAEGDYAANGGLDDYLATLRARLGWASGRSLFYATGGVAFMGENDNRAAGVGGTGGAGGNSGDGGTGGDGANGAGGQFTRLRSNEDNETGFVAGLGAETKISRKVSAGLEGLYFVFDESGSQDKDFFALRGRADLPHAGR